MNNLLTRIPNKFWAYVALSIWGALCFMLLHKNSYGIDEGAARALLLVWSVSDNVVSPVVTLGFPDFRTAFLAPAGILWTGNVLAAKISTMLVMAIAAWALHAWKRRTGDIESALIGTGLLLISPLLLMQIDTVSVGVYLLFAMVLGTWSDLAYRESNRAFSGMYFAQILLCIACITFHPAGLAYPLALLWTWHKNPLSENHRNYFFGGIIFAALFALLLTSGWNQIVWLGNPVRSLSSLLLGPAKGDDFGAFHWIAGVGMLCVLLLVLWKQARNLWADFLGRILLIALAISSFVGDETFGVIALAICLYWGLPLLLHNPTNAERGFWGQRGTVLVVVVALSTTFMMADKAHYLMVQAGSLSPRDSLIKVLAEDSGFFSNDDPATNQTEKRQIRVASQWPGLTMLACRCDALPLPPPAENGEALLKMVKGIDYLIFDPRDPANSSLAHNLAAMNAEEVETVALQAGGVIVQIKNHSAQKAPEKKS